MGGRVLKGSLKEALKGAKGASTNRKLFLDSNLKIHNVRVGIGRESQIVHLKQTNLVIV